MSKAYNGMPFASPCTSQANGIILQAHVWAHADGRGPPQGVRAVAGQYYIYICVYVPVSEPATDGAIEDITGMMHAQHL